MHLYEVGKPYVEGIQRWQEAVEYNYRNGAHELRMFVNKPSVSDIQIVREGGLKFYLYKRDSVIFFVYDFTAGFVGGCAYSYHLVPEAEQILPPEKGENDRDLLTIFLVDARTGILRALRTCTFSPRFTRALAEAIRDQAAKPFNPDYHNAIVNDEYARRTPEKMIEISYISCRAGD